VPALAQTGGMQRQHALSLIGTPKMPADYKNFDWVNPDAPKGGTVRQWAFGTFDSLNPYSVKGSPGGVPTLTSSALFANSPDEPAAEYALIAEWASYPADYSSVTFGLRPQARFSDGSPITPDDVIFSMEALKKAHPRYGYYYKNVVRAEATGAHEVTFTFDEKGNRELPQIVGELPILSKKWWEGKSPNGEQRDLARSTLEVPVGSGPYKIAAVDAGRSITYERIKDWWAKDLPVTKGQWNFDTLRLSYYRDRVAALEDFKAGNIDYWRESVAKSWALDFDFSAVSRGFVKKYEIPTKNVASMQAFVMNLRRPQFQDVRVRRAIGLALDFEAMNKNLFFGFYKRIDSYFGNSELQATGVPEGRELAILEEFRDQLPKELFTTPWQVPVNNTPQDLRAHMLEASKLLAEAGWKIGPDRRLHDAKNQMLAVEILIVQPEFERVVLPFKSNLELLGLQVSVRVVDSAQYERRITGFDYDMIVGGFPQSISPGNEQREFWGSQAADHQGSVNTIGIKNPVIDKLIDRIVFAKDREDLVAATRALDRVLLWNFYVVPQWYLDKEWIAAWDKFARPQTLPSQTSAFLQVWWYDAAADAKLSAARGR
jgi:microcin C transport system substrate-binding protein